MSLIYDNIATLATKVPKYLKKILDLAMYVWMNHSSMKTDNI